jgi:hypothetical protein
MPHDGTHVMVSCDVKVLAQVLVMSLERVGYCVTQAPEIKIGVQDDGAYHVCLKFAVKRC